MSGAGPVSFINLFDRFVDGLVAVVRLVCIVLATALFVIVLAAIVARYGFGRAVSWTEEVPRYLLIWVSFLGAAVCVVKREHVGFELLFDSLPPRLRRAPRVPPDMQRAALPRRPRSRPLGRGQKLFWLSRM